MTTLLVFFSKINNKALSNYSFCIIFIRNNIKYKTTPVPAKSNANKNPILKYLASILILPDSQSQTPKIIIKNFCNYKYFFSI